MAFMVVIKLPVKTESDMIGLKHLFQLPFVELKKKKKNPEFVYLTSALACGQLELTSTRQIGLAVEASSHEHHFRAP